MKYSGTITWLYADGSYEQQPVAVTIEENGFQGEYKYRQVVYTFHMRLQESDYFEGAILKGKKHFGKANMSMFTNTSDLLFQGNWEDFGLLTKFFMRLNPE